ncbi:pinin/SDK/memA/ protein conserved region-domain-containing protein [Cokeromyces recurvatus]|uniref:pinin/SDK/memA/ protein conserved region-domain-containing protein n=1 Tax=Cokeromyces recurvatus TaxID=90255 RepID=UPI00221EA210|nr:pinin/SDK/memA/ protein conserved region-domain-containing protein [Cokeromyces recurvatus]KAI7907838.1 pinin/SDK/memA/ protein conserved region-domain-containing protein [Cokeromyces recurvatus]
MVVPSSIIIPAHSLSSERKRPTDTTSEDNTSSTEEIKRPRLDDTEAGKNRNRRLFGALLGTLNKFKDETEKTSEIDKKRQAINEKLHERLELEKKQLAEKLKARKEEKMRLAEQKKQIEQKMWEEKKELAEIIQNEKLANFLKTNVAQPTLYYLPAKLTKEMEEIIKTQKEKASEARKRFEMKNDESDHDDRHHQNKSSEENNKDN